MHEHLTTWLWFLACFAVFDFAGVRIGAVDLATGDRFNTSPYGN